MEKRLREISHFFIAPRREFAPAVRARPRTPFSINTSTSVYKEMVLWQQHPSVASFMTSFILRMGNVELYLKYRVM